MKRILTIFFLLAFSLGLLAQEDSVERYYHYRTPKAHQADIEMGQPKELTNFIQQYFHQIHPWLQNDQAQLQLTYEKESLTGWHLLFQQYFQELPVFDAELKVNTVGKERITSYFDLTFDTRGWEQFGLKKAADETNWNAKVQAIIDGTGAISKAEKIIFYHPVIDQPVAAYRFYYRTPGEFMEYVIDQEGTLLLERSRKSNFTKDTTVAVNLFLPDPVTVDESEYGGQLQDFDDADYPYINDQLRTKTVTATFKNGQFHLERPYLKMADVEGDQIQAPVKDTNDFKYTRGQDAFEITHAYGHVVLFNEHLQSLGFTSATDFQLNLDARGNNTDNSYFTNTTPPQLVLGTGNVDDAEDGQVVIHEYGHALAHWASPNSNVGDNRNAMEEGFCDYFAVSYLRQYSDYRWEKVFKWDSGEGVFWNGRQANTEKQYPDDYRKSDIYYSGEIWSSVLMEIYGIVGPENADKLVTEFLFRLSKNMRYRQAGAELLDVSQILFGSAYQDEIFDRLLARGLLEEIETQITGREQVLRYNGNLAIYIDEVEPNATITIYNTQGQVVWQVDNLNTSFYQFPADVLPSSGGYIIRLQTNETEITKRFVKLNR